LSVPLLDLTDISKNFGAIQALNNVSLTLEHGEVVGLMGDTGAGNDCDQPFRLIATTGYGGSRPACGRG
jgi:ABC-type Na+ transport system ATPase subunit NatA